MVVDIYVWGLGVAFIGVFEGVGGVVLAGALVDVQRLQVHCDGDDAFELEFGSQRVPAEERCRVRGHPLLDESRAVKIRLRPVPVSQISRPNQSINKWLKCFFAKKKNGDLLVGCGVVLVFLGVVSVFFRADVHLDVVSLQIVKVGRPARFQVLVPRFV